ncbi:hypothetical protein GYMLUDRAFT_252535 [Collybiopsis luxurians FD-317 M1]|uniref:Uncharacterized protein n=1 Tax=Collybiopsis luxurians FD-317 M1 TaxID=944289 RepID=A0A0D0C001_9AGAR|nr:hypothetical protein GYMLUDRAFT_252535 [Collybiopsis luxurians FD-317 M1]
MSPGIPGLPTPNHTELSPSLLMTQTAAAATSAQQSSQDLLSDSPTDTEPALSQILALPPLPPHSSGQENLPYSAPPTMIPWEKLGWKDSREIFNVDGVSPSSVTLKSFPSVTDSARSWDADIDLDTGSGAGGEGDSSSRGRSARRYLKGDKDADWEESVSLWQKEEDEGEDDASQHGGIQLVTLYKGGSSQF